MGERWAPPDRFRPDEIGEASVGEQAEAMATARELEWLAASDDVAPSAGFADRVMAAVAAEPAPRPVTAAAAAVRRGSLIGIGAALGDLWRVAWTGGRPLASRAPAMALVVLLLAGTVGAGVLGVGALANLVDHPDQGPVPSPVASPSVAPPSPSASPSPVASPSPSASPSPVASPSPSPEEAESPEASPSARPTGSPPPAATPRPTRTPRPTETPRPTPTPDDDDDEETPEPTSTPDDD